MASLPYAEGHELAPKLEELAEVGRVDRRVAGRGRRAPARTPRRRRSPAAAARTRRQPLPGQRARPSNRSREEAPGRSAFLLEAGFHECRDAVGVVFVCREGTSRRDAHAGVKRRTATKRPVDGAAASGKYNRLGCRMAGSASRGVKPDAVSLRASPRAHRPRGPDILRRLHAGRPLRPGRGLLRARRADRRTRGLRDVAARVAGVRGRGRTRFAKETEGCLGDRSTSSRSAPARGGSSRISPRLCARSIPVSTPGSG